MVRSIKYQLILIFQYWLIGMGMVAGAIVLNLLLAAPGNPSQLASSTFGMLLGGTVMMSCVCVISIYSSYFQLALASGATRRNFFAGMQLLKFVAVFGFWCLLVGGLYVSEWFGAMLSSYFDVVPLIMAGGLMLIGAVAGECLGLLLLRFGKWGLFLYVSAFTLLSIFVTLLIIGAAHSETGILQAIFSVGRYPAWLAGGLLAFLVAGSVINWVIMRKITVR